MKYCQSCGSQIPDDSVFCSSCGKRVNDPWTTNSGTHKNNPSHSSQEKSFESEYCQGSNYSKNSTYTSGYTYTHSNNTSSNSDSYSPLAVLGMVFAFLASLIGLIISICAYNEAKRTGSQKNLGLSKMGIIISSVFIGLAVLSVFALIIISIVGIASLGALAI